MDYQSFYRRSIDDRDAFWAEQATLIDWERAPSQVCDYSQPPFARWFAGGLTNLCHNAVDRHLAQRADQNALIHVSTETDSERVYSFRRAPCRGAAHGGDPARAGRRAGRSRADLHAHDPRGGLRDAGLRAHRGDSLGGVRGLRQREPGQPHRRCPAEAGRQRRWRLACGQGGRVQAAARRGHRAGGPPARSRAAGRSRAGCDGAHRRPRPRLRRAARAPHGHARALHLGRLHPPQLHPLHQRHHRQAQGRAARYRRPRRGARRQHEAHLLRPGRRDLFLHQRHRLGRRAQLHRLWPADRRHGHHPLRRPADPPGCRHLVEPGREVQGHRDVQRADRLARAQEARPGLSVRNTTCRACGRCSWPASRSTSPPPAGSPTGWAAP